MKTFFLILLLFSQAVNAVEIKSYLQCFSELDKVDSQFVADYSSNSPKRYRAILDPKSFKLYLLSSEGEFFTPKDSHKISFDLSNSSKYEIIEDIVFIFPKTKAQMSYKLVNLYSSHKSFARPDSAFEGLTDLLPINGNESQLYRFELVSNAYTYYHTDFEIELEKVETNNISEDGLVLSLLFGFDGLWHNLRYEHRAYRKNPSKFNSPQLSRYLHALNQCNRLLESPRISQSINNVKQKLYEVDSKEFSIPEERFKIKRHKFERVPAFSTIAPDNTKDWKSVRQSDLFVPEFQCLEDLSKLGILNDPFTATYLNSVNQDFENSPFVVLRSSISSKMNIYIKGVGGYQFKLNTQWGYSNSANPIFLRRFTEASKGIIFDFTLTESRDLVPVIKNNRVTDYREVFYYEFSPYRDYFETNRVYYDVDYTELSKQDALKEFKYNILSYITIARKRKSIPETCKNFE
ncbi:MAG: hypothetical protein CL674_02630 [Bdellovibrionaceae bacterium]|nr:hypothetical protein [Pseudobdellovibrionaceae bacterium]|tara:strand:- start:103669 stop:105057 length:1389 start_codon:yes stop_codon:yes gene_type:complete